MYIKALEIKNDISEFYLEDLEDDVIYYKTGYNDVSKQGIFKYSRTTQSKIIEKQGKFIASFNISKKYLWVNNGKYCIYDKNGKFIKEIGLINKLSMNEIIICSKDELDIIGKKVKDKNGRAKRKLVLYNELLDKQIWQQDFSSTASCIHNDLLFCRPSSFIPHNNFLYCLNLKSGQLMWRFKVPSNKDEAFVLTKILGAFQDKVYINDHKNLVYAIDVKTGKPTAQWKFFGQPSLHDDKIVALTRTKYLELDLNSKELQTTIIEDQVKSNSLNISLPQYVGENKIVFSSKVSIHQLNSYKIGVFDIPTKKIAWVHDFEGEENGRIKKLQIENGKIYCLDDLGILHIFEEG